MVTQATIGELLAAGGAALAAAGIEAPRREARLLLAHALLLDPEGLLMLGRDREVARDRFDALLARRVAREPLAFLTGRQGFWTLELMVSPATLIPRADSEALIEALLESRPERGAVRRVLDLGTGTGCLLLAALSEYREAWGLGIDRSPEACLLAAANARAAGLGDRTAILCSDWTEPVGGGDGSGATELRFDVILGNPPYIRTDQLNGLMQEVVDWEPQRALDGGADGLSAYRQLMPILIRLLAPGGLAVLEVGAGQAGAVAELALAASLRPAETRADLGGIERALRLERPAGLPGGSKRFGMPAPQD